MTRRQWNRVALLAALVCLSGLTVACTGGNGSGSGSGFDGVDPPNTDDPPGQDPPPNDNIGGGVTIEGSDQSFATISEAILAARDGDVLELGPGIYRESPEFTRSVTLRGRDGPNTTILDGEQTRRVISIDASGAGTSARVTVRLEGITLRDGNANPGGAIWISNVDLECVDCVFDRCRSSDQGGAVTIQASSGSDHASATFIECVFRDCNSGSRGGAVFVSAGSGGSLATATFTRCRFEDNTGNQGGVILASAGSGTARVETRIEECLFQDNVGKDGGAILAQTGSGETSIQLVILNSLFVRNRASGEGSAVLARAVAGLSSVAVTIVQCSFSENVAPNLPGNRGAVAVTRGPLVGPARLDLYNSILWNNRPTQLNTVNVDRMVRNCIVMGGVPESSNSDADPLFQLPGSDNFRLRFDSPAVDAGDPELLPIGLDFDLDGAPRVQGGAPDLGAFERE